MGITGEIVKSVFSKSRSDRAHDINVKTSPGERKRWSTVRSYLCGDEINSVLEEEDSASWRSTKDSGTRLDLSSVYADEQSGSVRGSDASVTQPMVEDLKTNEEIESNEKKEESLKEKQNSTSKLFAKDDAAVVIQSAFRSFLAKKQNKRIELMNDEEALCDGNESPSRVSIGTSIEVQTAHSVTLHEEVSFHPHKTSSKGNRVQVWKLKEDWDDSTVSSNISKRRIQNKLEATTRRERALAYAFSQQLRICSKKKQSRSNDETEANMGWNWLERWMATRQQDNPLVVDISKQIEQLNGNQKVMVKRRLLVDLAGELEKESCGSNEVSLQLDSVPLSAPTEKDYYKPARNRLKATNMSKRKTVPTHNYSRENSKVRTKDLLKEDDKETNLGAREDGSKRESVCEDATSQVSPVTETSKNSR